jgi:hypothetical protein
VGFYSGRLAGAGLALAVVGWLPGLARSAPPSAAFPVSLALDVDGDGRTDQVTLDDAGQLVVRPSSQSGAAQTLNMEVGDRSAKLSRAMLSEQVLRSGQRVIAATAHKANGRRLALWAEWRANRLTTIYSGPIGPVGSDGEYSLGIEVSDGVLLRYQTSPTVERCDGEKRLFVESYGADGRWRPSLDAAMPKLDDAKTIAAGVEPPKSLSTVDRPLGMYQLVATSRQEGISRADLLTAPRELDDGRAQTAWRGSHDARGTFFTWRAELSGQALVALRIDPAPSSQGLLPSQVVVTVSPKESYRVSLSGSVSAGRPLWVVLPHAVTTSCVSLTIEQSGTRDGQFSALGDVSVYSDLDGGDAQAVLVGLLGSGDMRKAELGERTLLARIEAGDARRNDRLIPAIQAELSTSRSSARRRLHELLEALTRKQATLSDAGRDLLRDALLSAIRQAEAEERAALFVALGLLKTSSRVQVVPAVEALALNGKLSLPLRGEALLWLGEHGEPVSLLPLGKQLASEPTLRQSVQRALARKLHCMSSVDPRWRLVVDSLGSDAQSASWQALLGDGLAESALGCSDDVPKRLVADQLAEVWRGSARYPDEARFALRYRVLRALDRLNLVQPPSMLADALQVSEPAELRQQAARVLSRVQPLPSELADRVLRDEDPGVRTSLLTGLVGRRQDAQLSQLSQLVARDRWPMVRRAATEVLASQCVLGAGPPHGVVDALESSLRDGDEVVAQLGLHGLSRCLGATGLTRYLAILRDGKALAAVRGGSCQLVAKFGLSDAAMADKAHQALADGLADLIDDPMAGDRSVVAAVQCLRAIGEHGDGRDLVTLLGRLDREEPIGLRRGAADAVLRVCQRQRSPLSRDDQKGLSELLRMASEPQDGLLYGMRTKLQAACGPWSVRAR